MGATVFTQFDPEPTQLGTVISMIAGAPIKAGHVVFMASGAANWTVTPATSAAGTTIGVALAPQPATGGPVAVAGYGSVVRMMNARDDVGIDAGDHVGAGGTAGMIIAVSPYVGGADCTQIGIALEDISPSGVGYVLINGPLFTPLGVA